MSGGRLAGKVAVVTGAAGGIGESTARLFAREGARVVLADYMGEAVAAHAADIEEGGGQAVGVTADVREMDDVRRAIETATDRWGRLDVLHNNVGVNFHALIGEASEEHFLECLNINLLSVYRGCHVAAPIMQAQGGGSIINTSSVQGIMGFDTYSAYASAKAGMLGLTRQMAVDYGCHGIRVNAVLPGGIDTPMWRAEVAAVPDIQALIDESASRIPLQRIGEADDIANAVLFLASDESSYVTGTAASRGRRVEHCGDAAERALGQLETLKAEPTLIGTDRAYAEGFMLRDPTREGASMGMTKRDFLRSIGAVAGVGAAYHTMSAMGLLGPVHGAGDGARASAWDQATGSAW